MRVFEVGAKQGEINTFSKPLRLALYVNEGLCKFWFDVCLLPLFGIKIDLTGPTVQFEGRVWFLRFDLFLLPPVFNFKLSVPVWYTVGDVRG